MGEDFLKEGEELQTAELEREGTWIKVESKISAQNWGLCRRISLSQGREGKDLWSTRCGLCLMCRLVGEGCRGTGLGFCCSECILTFVFETDDNNTESSSQQPRTPTAGVYKYHLDSTDLSSHQPLTQDTEVLLFGLKSNTQYKATVYPQAADGTEGQPRNVTFRTGMLNFVECLQPVL